MSASSGKSEHQNAHCIHIVGIGRTGAAYVEALLRTGEIEDQLVNPGARFAALVVDAGDDDDMGIAMDYAASFKRRLETRGIPAERFHFDAVVLPPPSEALMVDLVESSDFLRGKAQKMAVPELKAANTKTPLALGPKGHAPRAVAKAMYASAYYGGERPLDMALAAFAKHVQAAALPSFVTVCFGLAGGLGGGIAIDLARHLSNVKLGRKVPVVGVGQLPSSGDPEATQAGPGLYVTLNDLDCMLDETKNAAIVAAWGETYRGPFTGGFFAVNPEQSWQRLTAYTTTGEKNVRHRFKQTVTNRFVADSFMRLAVTASGQDLVRALVLSGLTGSGDAVSGGGRPWTLFDVAKLTHPGVQVLPGESRNKWGSVIGQWIDFTPQWSGLADGFKTDYAEVFIYASRNMEQEMMKIGFKKMINEHYLIDGSSKLEIYFHEFFDTLTAYANMVLPGVAKTDLLAFWASQRAYDVLPPDKRLQEHAWLVDTGVKLPPGSAALEPAAGSAVWGAAGWGLVAADALRGEVKPAVARRGVGAQIKMAS